MDLFIRVKELADKRKMSLNELEEAVGFSRNTLYKWKDKMPNSEKLEDVADYFGVSTDYLLGRVDDPTPVEIDSESSLGKLAVFLRTTADEIPEEKKDQFTQEAEQFLDYLKTKFKQ